MFKIKLPSMHGSTTTNAKPHLKKCPNHFKHPRLSKSQNSIVRGFSFYDAKLIREFHKKQMLETAALREKYEASKNA